ncbi:MAG: hypothetical protein MSJ26_07320 [Oscillospiraceae bacterium]|nr:hypothetical protein [Oscillospiraceae bacterium]
MNELYYGSLSFIPSETMRKYIAGKLSENEFELSAEDVISIVCNGGGDIFAKRDYYKKLLETELSENTRSELLKMISWIDMTESCIKGSKGYSFACGDIWDNRIVLFNSFRKAAKYTLRHKKNDIVICDMSLTGEERFISLLEIDEKSRVIYSGKFVREAHFTDHVSLKNRYVKFPVPFKTGDTVYYAGDRRRELFSVINAHQPEPWEMADFMDSSIMVIPYRYHEYATPENVRAHYERNMRRKAEGKLFYDDDPLPDVISREHDHMSVIYTELYKEYEG